MKKRTTKKDPFPKHEYYTTEYAITYRSQKEAQKALDSTTYPGRVVGDVLEVDVKKTDIDNRYDVGSTFAGAPYFLSIDPILRLPFPPFSSNKEFSDVTLLVGRRKFPVHRIILATVSDYFNSMFSNNKEKNQTEVRLKEVEPKEFERVLSLMYGESQIIHGIEGLRLLVLVDYFDMRYVNLDDLIPELGYPPVKDFGDYLTELNKLYQLHEVAVDDYLGTLLEVYYDEDQLGPVKEVWEQLPKHVQTNNDYMLNERDE